MSTPPEDPFAAVFGACHDALMRYAVRRVGAAEAPDVVAETFAIALRRWPGGTAPREPLPWLYAVAHNLIRNHRRREAWVAMPAFDHGLLAIDDAPEDRLALLAALRALSPEDREVLMLTAWEGLDAAAMGRVLGCSAVAARVRLHRARQRFLAATQDSLPIPRRTPS